MGHDNVMGPSPTVMVFTCAPSKVNNRNGCQLEISKMSYMVFTCAPVEIDVIEQSIWLSAGFSWSGKSHENAIFFTIRES